MAKKKQGLLGDIMSGISGTPLVGDAVAVPRAMVQMVEGKNPTNTLLEGVPGYGTAVALSDIFGGGGGGGSTSPGKSTTPTATTSTANNKTPASSYDPLALQQLWTQMQPLFASAAKMAGNAGPDYLAAMNQAISGSHQSPQVQAQQQSDAKAMSDLLQSYAGSNLATTFSGPAFDQLINWLSQATGAAQLAQGAAEKNIAYGGAVQNAAALGIPSAQSALGSQGTGTAGTGAASTGTPNTNNLSPTQAAALLQQTLSGGQTSSSVPAGVQSNNPLLPNPLLQSQGVG